ncbi:MAG: hypothetical protein A3I54_04445 [Candidatus Levybacteria bacterium RIFCSPLOWO2_02_FULL_41_11]|nr:MAG: hypothetical protein A3I54_04445 [Candidatus Levybacteria bacterium RIFCSPLOWO2_02_FULL_41_11]
MLLEFQRAKVLQELLSFMDFMEVPKLTGNLTGIGPREQSVQEQLRVEFTKAKEWQGEWEMSA